jgi:hypothetical protein
MEMPCSNTAAELIYNNRPDTDDDTPPDLMAVWRKFRYYSVTEPFIEGATIGDEQQLLEAIGKALRDEPKAHEEIGKIIADVTKRYLGNFRE